jgi:glycosyltransferase involved in cell wall biosynthesis
MKLSVVIPARDEEGSIEQTVAEIAGGPSRRADSV